MGERNKMFKELLHVSDRGTEIFAVKEDWETAYTIKYSVGRKSKRLEGTFTSVEDAKKAVMRHMATSQYYNVKGRGKLSP